MFKTPDNLVDLLDRVVRAALKTPFYRALLPHDARIASLEDFRRLPVTPIARFREQRLGRVVSDPARVQWIVGAHRGQDPTRVAVAEGLDDTAARYGVFRDAMRAALPDGRGMSGAVLADPRRRYFAAEVSTMLGHIGIPTHIFLGGTTARSEERLRQIGPRLVVLLDDGLDATSLPSSVELCVTVRGSHRLQPFRQLDLYLVDEFGFLGHSTDLKRWVVYNDQYLLEISGEGKLIVTALHNRTQPLVRLETEDAVEELGESHVKLGRLSASG